VSRTIGWFTTLRAIRLVPGVLDVMEISADTGAAAALLRLIDLQAAQEAPSDAPAPSIGFNFLGNIGTRGEGDRDGDSGDWQPVGEHPVGTDTDPTFPALHSLEFGGFLTAGDGGASGDGRRELILLVSWAERGDFGEPEAMRIAEYWLEALAVLGKVGAGAAAQPRRLDDYDDFDDFDDDFDDEYGDYTLDEDEFGGESA
jgi:hypothetical protein